MTKIFRLPPAQYALVRAQSDTLFSLGVNLNSWKRLAPRPVNMPLGKYVRVCRGSLRKTGSPLSAGRMLWMGRSGSVDLPYFVASDPPARILLPKDVYEAKMFSLEFNLPDLLALFKFGSIPPLDFPGSSLTLTQGPLFALLSNPGAPITTVDVPLAELGRLGFSVVRLGHLTPCEVVLTPGRLQASVPGFYWKRYEIWTVEQG